MAAMVPTAHDALRRIAALPDGEGSYVWRTATVVAGLSSWNWDPDDWLNRLWGAYRQAQWSRASTPFFPTAPRMRSAYMDGRSADEILVTRPTKDDWREQD
jgi:hypothetical protein